VIGRQGGEEGRAEMGGELEGVRAQAMWFSCAVVDQHRCFSWVESQPFGRPDNFLGRGSQKSTQMNCVGPLDQGQPRYVAKAQ
jgi:hypothetical protein